VQVARPGSAPAAPPNRGRRASASVDVSNPDAVAAAAKGSMAMSEIGVSTGCRRRVGLPGQDLLAGGRGVLATPGAARPSRAPDRAPRSRTSAAGQPHVLLVVEAERLHRAVAVVRRCPAARSSAVWRRARRRSASGAAGRGGPAARLPVIFGWIRVFPAGGRRTPTTTHGGGLSRSTAADAHVCAKQCGPPVNRGAALGAGRWTTNQPAS
jgi:hypothetical protein